MDAVVIEEPVTCDDAVNKFEGMVEVDARGVVLIIPVPKRFVEEAIADDDIPAVKVNDIKLLLVAYGESVIILVTVLEREVLLLEVDETVFVAAKSVAVFVNDGIDDSVGGMEVIALTVDKPESKGVAENIDDTLLIDEVDIVGKRDVAAVGVFKLEENGLLLVLGDAVGVLVVKGERE